MDLVRMLDPYDAPYPDGPLEDDVPAPLLGPSWLDDDDVHDDWPSDFSLMREDPE